jgi:WD40 repeat protein
MGSKMRHNGAVYCTALTDEERVISGSGDNKVFMWDLSRDEPMLEMLGHEASVHCCDVMANGRSLLTGSFDHTVQRWDTLSGSSVQKLNVSEKDANVNTVAEVAGGNFIAAGSV